jgi:hypothetical protein
MSSGLLDLHLQGVLDSMWPLYRDNFTAFNQLVGAPNLVSETQVTAWWNDMRANKLIFKQAFAPGPDQLPICYVQHMGSREVKVPMGRRAYTDTDGRVVDQIWIEQSAVVRLAVKDKELARVLTQVLIACIHTAFDNMYRAGYLNVRYTDSDGPVPLDEWIAEEYGMTGVYVVPMRVVAESWMSLKHWESPVVQAGTIQVLASDIVGLDGVRGGVVF